MKDTFFTQRKRMKYLVYHQRSEATHFFQGSTWCLQMTYRSLQLDHVYNVPHQRTLIDELLYSTVSSAPPPHHPPPKTVILQLAVVLVLSSAGSKALFNQCKKTAHEERALIVWREYIIVTERNWPKISLWRAPSFSMWLMLHVSCLRIIAPTCSGDLNFRRFTFALLSFWKHWLDS